MSHHTMYRLGVLSLLANTDTANPPYKLQAVIEGMRKHGR